MKLILNRFTRWKFAVLACCSLCISSSDLQNPKYPANDPNTNVMYSLWWLQIAVFFQFTAKTWHSDAHKSCESFLLPLRLSYFLKYSFETCEKRNSNSAVELSCVHTECLPIPAALARLRNPALASLTAQQWGQCSKQHLCTSQWIAFPG